MSFLICLPFLLPLTGAVKHHVGVAPYIVFVRHAETVANATGRYNSKTIDQFSELGKKQVSALNGQLLGMQRFNQIFVSPSTRALRTIAPYLQAIGAKAIVWPELYECCTGKRPKNAHPEPFSWGSKIRIPRDLAGQFVLQKGHDRLPAVSTYNQGLAQINAAIVRLHEVTSPGAILIIGHSGMGGGFIYALTGKHVQVKNATLIQVGRPQS